MALVDDSYELTLAAGSTSLKAAVPFCGQERLTFPTRLELEAALLQLVQLATDGGCEGFMVKGLSGSYQPGSRTKAWMKLKKDYAGMAGGDTLDVVPIGG